MNKNFLLLSLVAIGVASAQAQVQELSGAHPGREGREGSIVQKGDRLQIQTVTPLSDRPSEVTVIALGPKSWVLCEYDFKFVRRNADGATEEGKEKVKLWVNFDHVIAAKKIEAK